MAVVKGVDRWKIGYEVCALSAGGYAQYVAIDARQAMAVPPYLSMIEAAPSPEISRKFGAGGLCGLT